MQIISGDRMSGFALIPSHWYTSRILTMIGGSTVAFGFAPDCSLAREALREA